MNLPPLRVVVADDEPVLRQVVADLVAAQEGFELVGTAADHLAVRAVVASTDVDLVLLDVRMPGGTAAGTIETLRTSSPRTVVVALSAFDDNEDVAAVLAAGAAGYQLKGDPDHELLEALHRAARGQLSMPTRLAGHCFRWMLRELDRSRGSEAGLRRSRATLQDLLDRLPAGVVLLDPDDQILLANAQADRLFRRPLSGMFEEPAAGLLAQESRAEFLALLRRVAEDDDVPVAELGEELVGLRGDGSRFEMSVEMRPLVMTDDRLIAVFVRDLGESHAVEVRYHRLIESSPDALLIVDATGRIELLNAEVERIFGFERGDLLGRSIETILPGYPSRAVLGLTGPGSAEALTLTARRSQGPEFPVDVRASPLNDEAGACVLAVQDATERRRHETALEETFQSLEEAGKEHQWLLTQLVRAQEDERKRISAGIHDDSLQAITAAALRVQQLRRRLRSPGDQEVLDRLDETLQLSITRLRQLIFDLRPPAERLGGLQAALQAYVDQLDVDGATTVTITSDLTSELPQESQLVAYRIAQEALANVWKHAAATEVQVRLLEVGNGILVVIDDNGQGYEPADAEGRPGHLGLTLMQERAQIAGGWCRVESAPGAGATVQFWIPARRTDLAATSPALAPSAGSGLP